MAAYDQVLAKLGSVSSPTLADAADLDLKTRGKRKASTSADEKDSHVSVATPPVKTRNKKSKSSGASTEHVAAIPIMHKAAAAEAEAKLHDISSNSVAATILPSTVEKTAAAKASHLARFGRRRAGQERLQVSALPPTAVVHEHPAQPLFWHLQPCACGQHSGTIQGGRVHVHRLAGAAYLVLMDDLHV